MKSVRTWILIADGRSARVYQTSGGAKALEAVEDMTFETESPPSRELASDRPGRSYESKGHARHAIESRSDPHREAKRQFAHRLAGAIEAQQAAKRFDKLVVVAPAVTMGDLRAAFSDGTKSAITSELVADLTKVPLRDLPSHLESVLSP
jgi:protein required for attachment to host cells